MTVFRAKISKPLPGLPATRLFAFAGLACIFVPTFVSIAGDYWSSEEGTQGPIIFATGVWLLWRARAVMVAEAAPRTGPFWPLVMVPLALLYAFARIYRILPLESTMAYLIGLVAAVIYLGPALVRRFWFPFLYPAFLIVPPSILVSDLTLPLKIWISSVSADLLQALGYPVAVSGATIAIGQYALLVRKVCAGLGSLLTLCAVGLFYVHLRRDAGVRFGAALLIAIIPIAIFANLVRVIAIVLVTWYFGAAIGQGMAHEVTGLIMFTVAMAAMFAIDNMLSALGPTDAHRNA